MDVRVQLMVSVLKFFHWLDRQTYCQWSQFRYYSHTLKDVTTISQYKIMHKKNYFTMRALPNQRKQARTLKVPVHIYIFFSLRCPLQGQHNTAPAYAFGTTKLFVAFSRRDVLSLQQLPILRMNMQDHHILCICLYGHR